MACGTVPYGETVGEVLRAVRPVDITRAYRLRWVGPATCNQWECCYCVRRKGLVLGSNLQALSTWLTGTAPGVWGKIVGWLSESQNLRPLFFTSTLPGVPGRTVGECVDIHNGIMAVLTGGRTRKRLYGYGLVAGFRKFDDTLSTGSGFWNRHGHQHGVLWVQGLTAEEVNDLVRPYVLRAIERATGAEGRPESAFRAEEARGGGIYGYAASGAGEIDERGKGLTDPIFLETVGVGKTSAKGSWNLHEALAALESGTLEAEADGELREWYRERWEGLYNRKRISLMSWQPAIGRGAWKQVGATLDIPASMKGASWEAVREVYPTESAARRSRIRHGRRPTGEPVVMESLRDSSHGVIARRIVAGLWERIAVTEDIGPGAFRWLCESSERLEEAEVRTIQPVLDDPVNPDFSGLYEWINGRGDSLSGTGRKTDECGGR